MISRVLQIWALNNYSKLVFLLLYTLHKNARVATYIQSWFAPTIKRNEQIDIGIFVVHSPHISRKTLLPDENIGVETNLPPAFASFHSIIIWRDRNFENRREYLINLCPSKHLYCHPVRGIICFQIHIFIRISNPSTDSQCDLNDYYSKEHFDYYFYIWGAAKLNLLNVHLFWREYYKFNYNLK